MVFGNIEPNNDLFKKMDQRTYKCVNEKPNSVSYIGLRDVFLFRAQLQLLNAISRSNRPTFQCVKTRLCTKLQSVMLLLFLQKFDGRIFFMLGHLY